MNLATNKLVDAGTVFGHGVLSLVVRVANVAAAVALGCYCSIGGLLYFGVNGPSPSLNFLIMGLGIS